MRTYFHPKSELLYSVKRRRYCHYCHVVGMAFGELTSMPSIQEGSILKGYLIFPCGKRDSLFDSFTHATEQLVSFLFPKSKFKKDHISGIHPKDLTCSTGVNSFTNDSSQRRRSFKEPFLHFRRKKRSTYCRTFSVD